MAKLKRNAARCLSCGDVIESKRVHNYVKCGCGKIAVDGGLEYARRNFPEHPWSDWFEELSEYETEET